MNIKKAFLPFVSAAIILVTAIVFLAAGIRRRRSARKNGVK